MGADEPGGSGNKMTQENPPSAILAIFGSVLHFSLMMFRLSPVEIVFLAVLMASSAAAFWRRFGVVLRTIRISKPDAERSRTIRRLRLPVCARSARA